ncbi:CHD3-type chromatin-remodeling factor PICKLE-like isoform X2 [Phaseolus vulgaris]|uniref:CHD3-type chromatin-remodeling factor PICKLE-like isoform X2 n=1 Tax=Phaseolus vulgaris TaxID=3885 RepID=UPI0035CC446F
MISHHCSKQVFTYISGIWQQKENACQACGEKGDLRSCETCSYSFHPCCILSPVRSLIRDSWTCSQCASPMNGIDKILDCEMRSVVATGESDATKLESKQNFVKQYLVKWKGLSYLHCTWVPEEEFLKAYESQPGLKIKINSFHHRIDSAKNPNEDFVPIRPEWTMVDRIIACSGSDDKKEYLVKWKELPYDECYWELESDISAFQIEIERFNTFQSRSREGSESNNLQKEFVQYENSPQFLSGGSLHPYQLEGLNFLRSSWSKQTHVILSDEMGLGKTIPSIAFLASLFEENVSPHLVVAPLSTLRNWEREFATWAPHMNVVMYFGSANARAIIRECEFYFSKSGYDSKQGRIKFDVLLTSYEMINSDSSSLKPIKWESMIVDEEGHHLKNKNSGLFSSLKQYSTKCRVLLSGTPLQTMSTSSKCRPRYSFYELDEEDQVISPRKHGKSTEKDVEIDGNDTNVEGLRGRSSQRKKKYTIDDSDDDDSVILPRKRGRPKQKNKKIDTSDTNESGLVERLRERSCKKKPNYILYEPDEEDAGILLSKNLEENLVKIERSDTKENACQACGEKGDLLSCETCSYSFHPSCIISPVRSLIRDNWRCPLCASPMNGIDKILDCEMRSVVAAGESDATKLESKQTLVKQYLVKWKGLSYLHCTWVPEEEFLKTYKTQPGLKIKVNSFHRRMAAAKNPNEDFVPIRSEWTMVDRIIACSGSDDKKEYLVKWKELPYDECYWELEADISAFQTEIERFNTFQSRSRKVSSSKKSSIQFGSESNNLQKEFLQYESSPQFLSGGSLHPYQLEGLNFLRFSWSKQTHVILADEMGLGKTIQSIAFLASLFEENVSPHLVVAPLSTLRNWEREFATWAPHMNVVMYFGSANARAIIREYEFYFPKNQNVKKKNKSKKSVYDSKQGRIKFDVLLTSYEMINSDSSSLKPIKWESMIVDEGHRLKNKNSRLFSALKQYSTKHRVLLTGTPLQNNLDELFMLMHFLDAGKFGSLEEFQEEFKDINREEQILRLHKMLAPHLLRRMKKDVLTELPPKKELILRVELSSLQKEYYKAILTRNYEILTRQGGAQISLINVVMELRKLCCHPFMLQGVQPVLNDDNQAHEQLLESSGKLQLLDKLMVKLKVQGHRVLIYSQFQRMLDLLEDYCSYRQWQYERIDGKVGGAERQVKIDLFNAEDSSRFCFLLSTRAGGLGINLTTADTVILYDSDWNPHADLQAMARAHRLGQTRKVMVYRLITRGTIEEKMIQMTKKKMVLEHLVVGKLQSENIKQEELDDIVRYGSEELFADENDEAGKSRQIHYDADAIDRLLNRDEVGNEEAPALDGEDEDGFLKAFKVANFEYIEEAEVAEEVAENVATENQSSAASLKKANHWEELLKERYEQQRAEELNALGKGKRTCTKWQGEGSTRWGDLSSDGEDVKDDNYEVDLSEDDSISFDTTTRPHKTKPHKTKDRESPEPLPVMEGKGRSLKVLGFSRNQRADFVQILMRFGVGDFDWSDFTARMKQKSFEEIHMYGQLFLSHIAEEITDSPTFTDGVPKEGLQIPDVLVRIAALLLLREKVKFISENPETPLFSDDILSRYPGLKATKIWKEEHDVVLLHAMLKHGYERWHDIAEDKDLNLQKVICQELNIPVLQSDVTNVQSSCPPSGENVRSDIAADGANMTNVESSFTKSKKSVSRGSSHRRKQVQAFRKSVVGHDYKQIQKAQTEFIKKRFRLLEKGLNAECQKEYYGDSKPNELETEEHKGKGTRVDVTENIASETDESVADHLPQVKGIDTEDIYTSACDFEQDRLQLVSLYNEMCSTVEESAMGLVETATDQAQQQAIQNLGLLQSISADINTILNGKDIAD